MPRAARLTLALILIVSCLMVAAPTAKGAPTTPVAGGTPASTCPSTTPAQNAALVRRYWEVVYNQGKLDALADFLTPGTVQQRSTGETARGIAAREAFIASWRAAFPDAHWTVDDTIAAGDQVVVHITMRGTQLGPYRGIAPTGRRVTFTNITIYRIACGRIASATTEADNLGLYQQLGALPPVGTPVAGTPVAQA